jgi:hypothetical protein
MAVFGKNHEKVYFKTDATGRMAFYPVGVLGKGYVVTPAEAAEIEAYIRRRMAWVMPLLLVQVGLQVFVGFWAALAIMAGPVLIFSLVFRSGLRRRTKGLPASETRMTVTDTIGNQARYMSARRAYSLVLVGIIMTLGAGYTALHEQGSTAWIGAAGVLFFGYGVIHGLRILRARWTGA